MIQDKALKSPLPLIIYHQDTLSWYFYYECQLIQSKPSSDYIIGGKPQEEMKS